MSEAEIEIGKTDTSRSFSHPRSVGSAMWIVVADWAETNAGCPFPIDHSYEVIAERTQSLASLESCSIILTV